MRSGRDSFNLEPNLVTQQIAGCSGRDQLVFGEPGPIEGGEGDQVGLLTIVRDDREARAIVSRRDHRWHSLPITAFKSIRRSLQKCDDGLNRMHTPYVTRFG